MINKDIALTSVTTYSSFLYTEEVFLKKYVATHDISLSVLLLDSVPADSVDMERDYYHIT